MVVVSYYLQSPQKDFLRTFLCLNDKTQVVISRVGFLAKYWLQLTQ